MFISRVVFISPFYNYLYTSLYRNERSLLKDLQMFYGYFVFIKEVVENYLTSFTIKRAYYLIIIKLDVINLRPFLINRIDNYKHLISRI